VRANPHSVMCWTRPRAWVASAPHVEDRLPVGACGLHGHSGHREGHQSVRGWDHTFRREVQGVCLDALVVSDKQFSA